MHQDVGLSDRGSVTVITQKTHTPLRPQVCESIGDVSAEVTPPAVTVLAGENESVNECNQVDFRRPFSSEAFSRNATNGHATEMDKKAVI